MVEGTDGQLYGMEVDVEAAKAELREIASRNQGKGATDFLRNIGLGAFSDQLADLKLGIHNLSPSRALICPSHAVKRLWTVQESVRSSTAARTKVSSL